MRVYMCGPSGPLFRYHLREIPPGPFYCSTHPITTTHNKGDLSGERTPCKTTTMKYGGEAC